LDYIKFVITKYVAKRTDFPNSTLAICTFTIKKENYDAFVKTFNELAKNRESVIKYIEKEIINIFDIDILDKSIITKEAELSSIRKSIESLIEENSRVMQDQKQYQSCYNLLEKNYTAVKRDLDELVQEKTDKEQRLSAIKLYIQKLKEIPTFIDKFSTRLWNLVIDVAIVNKDKTVTFIFKDGQKQTFPL